MASTPPQKLYLCLDGGGTKTRAVISRKIEGGGAEIVAEGLAAGSNLAEVSRESVLVFEGLYLELMGLTLMWAYKAGLTTCVQESVEWRC